VGCLFKLSPEFFGLLGNLLLIGAVSVSFGLKMMVHFLGLSLVAAADHAQDFVK
jgi:hypothetical protein